MTDRQQKIVSHLQMLDGGQAETDNDALEHGELIEPLLHLI